jgi:hypothetical protein
MRRTINILLYGLGGLVLITATLAAVGSLRATHVVTVTRETTATREQIWQLWADVPERTRWDDGLEWIRVDGPFETGATGEVKLKGQPAVRLEILECDPARGYTDRFFLPAGARMDWHHTILDRGNGTRVVTFRVVVKGPTALMLTPVLKRILGDELPATVDRLVALAEETGRTSR